MTTKKIKKEKLGIIIEIAEGYSKLETGCRRKEEVKNDMVEKLVLEHCDRAQIELKENKTYMFIRKIITNKGTRNYPNYLKEIEYINRKYTKETNDFIDLDGCKIAKNTIIAIAY